MIVVIINIFVIVVDIHCGRNEDHGKERELEEEGKSSTELASDGLLEIL